jgi:hypothetical protein
VRPSVEDHADDSGFADSIKMCFYDINCFTCDCWKWSHFRQHCSKEYRTGETCGMRLTMNTYKLNEKCKICTKIDTKERAIKKEDANIRRWAKEGGRSASIEKAEDNIFRYEEDIIRLTQERDTKRNNLARW